MVMMMKLKHIDELSGGRKRFRRRYPKAVAEIMGETFFQVPMNGKLRKPALGLIWSLLEGTGCRGAEIVGLRVEDVILDGPYPHIGSCGMKSGG